MTVSKDLILKELSKITIPQGNIVELDYVRALSIQGNKVSFVLEVPNEMGASLEPVRQAAVELLEKMDGVDKASVVMTAQKSSDSQLGSKGPPPDLKLGGHPKAQDNLSNLTQVKKIIAVASGKGGVGKSTVSVNLAVAMSQMGYKVGLLDADIHGPSLPMMMGTSKKPYSPDGKTIIPLTLHGVKVMSIGLLLPKDEAVIWRGPMLMGALQQMLQQVKWDELDVLIVDLPPGTGDVQLTLCQRFNPYGAIIVCTPQDLALLDARRAIGMFNKLNTPILGMVENMSHYCCPKCNHKEYLFGRKGMLKEAKKIGVPILGEIPLELTIRESGDKGSPVALAKSETAKIFKIIAGRLV